MAEKKDNKDKQVQTRYTMDEYLKLKAQADKEGRTVSNLTHTVMMDYLNNKQ